MATYVPISDSETDPGAPFKSSLAKRFADNLEAVREGDGSAPRIDSIAAMDHEGAFGARGTYVLAMVETSASLIFEAGDTIQGSALRPAGFAMNGETPNALNDGTHSTTALVGSWRAMGRAEAVGGTDENIKKPVTLWLRFA
jgi:hypothetical protein